MSETYKLKWSLHKNQSCDTKNGKHDKQVSLDRFLCNYHFSLYASLISLHLAIYIGGDLMLYVYCIQKQSSYYMHNQGGDHYAK